MDFIDASRSPKVLLKQKDLHFILIVVMMDFILTVHGITTNAGYEANPFFEPLVGSIGGMIIGELLYLGILLIASYLIVGKIRSVLTSFVFGMHVGGTLTWLPLIFTSTLGPFLNVFWFLVGATGATSLFYWYFNDRKKQRG